MLCSLYICRSALVMELLDRAVRILSLAPYVITLPSIRLTTGLMSHSYMGQAIISTCGPLVANHPHMGDSSKTHCTPQISVNGLIYPLRLRQTHPGLGPVAEKYPSWSIRDSNPRPPGSVPYRPIYLCHNSPV